MESQGDSPKPFLVHSYSAQEVAFYLHELAFGLEDHAFYVGKLKETGIVEKFDSAASKCMSGVEGRLMESSSEAADNVQITGFNGSFSRPTEIGVNRDGKTEYYVPNMPRNLVLLCANAYAKEGAAILLKDSGFVLRLNESELNDLLNFMKQYPVTKTLRVRNSTYEIDPYGSEGTAHLAEEVEPLVGIGVDVELEEGMSSTATKFFNTKVHVSNETDRVLTLLLTGLSFRDWYLNVKNNSLDGVPPDVNERMLNSFEHKYGRTPDIIRLASPMIYRNRQGLMADDAPLSAPDDRVEIDAVDPPFNEDAYSIEAGEVRKQKIKSYGGAKTAVLSVDCFSGYLLGELLSTLANPEKFVEKFVAKYNLHGVTVKHISADSGVLSQSESQVLTPKCERLLTDMGITSERSEPYNHSRGTSSVERAIRTVKELMRLAMTFVLRNPNLNSIGFTKELILPLWGETFLWAITVSNLKPCPHDATKTKYEVYWKKKPNMQNIRLLPIFSVLMVTREVNDKNSAVHGVRNQIALYAGPSLKKTPGAIRTAVLTGGNVRIITTSRITGASDGGGFNVYPHIARGVRRLIADFEDSGAETVAEDELEEQEEIISHDNMPKSQRQRRVTFRDRQSVESHQSTSSQQSTPISVPDSEPSSSTFRQRGLNQRGVEPPRRSDRISKLNQQNEEKIHLAEEEAYDAHIDSVLNDEEPLMACFADWSTHSTTCDYFSFADNSFIRVEGKPLDDLPAAFFADTEEGYRAVTENVPKSFAAALKDPIWGEPARKELNTLISTRAIVEVSSALAHDAIKNHGANLVVLFPVYERKIRDGLEVFKVRLVGDGRTHYNAGNTYAGTPSREELYILLHVIAALDWDFALLDEVRAFLTAKYNGKCRAFTKLRGDNEKFFEVLGALYGLKSSPKDYQDNVAERFLGLGFQRLVMCNCIYVLRVSEDIMIIFAFVDDFVVTGSNRALMDAKLAEFRSVATTTEPIWDLPLVLGMEISRDRTKRTISCTMVSKIDELNEKYGVKQRREPQIPLSNALLLCTTKISQSYQQIKRPSLTSLASPPTCAS